MVSLHSAERKPHREYAIGCTSSNVCVNGNRRERHRHISVLTSALSRCGLAATTLVLMQVSPLAVICVRDRGMVIPFGCISKLRPAVISARLALMKGARLAQDAPIDVEREAPRCRNSIRFSWGLCASVCEFLCASRPSRVPPRPARRMIVGRSQSIRRLCSIAKHWSQMYTSNAASFVDHFGVNWFTHASATRSM